MLGISPNWTWNMRLMTNGTNLNLKHTAHLEHQSDCAKLIKPARERVLALFKVSVAMCLILCSTRIAVRSFDLEDQFVCGFNFGFVEYNIDNRARPLSE